ncbi:MAG: hypothetical protein J1D77_00515 [Muribaculaceae bacterium]|nr:hypothetical protein [Muribaculaceae bacterium]
MKNFSKYILPLLSIMILSALTMSCTQDEPKDSPFVDPDKPNESTVLIYAVATNSLWANLLEDKIEMTLAGPDIDLSKNNVLIYQTIYGYDEEDNRVSEASIVKLVKQNDPVNPYGWETVKEYSNETGSLNPSRVAEVIDYVKGNFPADSYGLVFWSHSTASQPSETTRAISSMGSSVSSPVALPELGYFGEDQTTSQKEYTYLDIDLLAQAVPDGLFEYIWFDSCLMSNIETIYQFRNKCETFVAYPTEVLDKGLPYHLVLPCMVGKDKDLVEAANRFFQYYSESFGTIAVADMKKLGALTDFCREIFSPGVEISVSDLTKYSRKSIGPFYDFGQYLASIAKAQGIDYETGFSALMNDFLMYKATTSGRLLNLTIDPETYSGISAHVYSFGVDDVKESYYKSLDWYKEVFGE